MHDNSIPFTSYREPGSEKLTGNRYSATFFWQRDALYVLTKEHPNGEFNLLEGYKVATWKIAAGIEKLPGRLIETAKNSVKKTVIIQSVQSCFAPKTVVQKESFESILAFNHLLPKQSVVMTAEIPGTDIVSIYAADKKMLDFINRLFDFPEIIHTSNVLVAFLMQAHKNHLEDDQLFGYVSGQMLELVRFTGGKPEFYNQFEFKSDEDFIYYLLFIAGQLGINPESGHFIMGGDFEGTSGIIRFAEKYIRNVSLMQRSGNIPTGPVLNQVPGHRHLLLFNGELCVS
jgi:hypothetical protein